MTQITLFDRQFYCFHLDIIFGALIYNFVNESQEFIFNHLEDGGVKLVEGSGGHCRHFWEY